MSANARDHTTTAPSGQTGPGTTVVPAARTGNRPERKDKVFQAFLEGQYREGMAFARQSDVVQLTPIGSVPPQHFLADFNCRGAARARGGEVVIARRRHVVGIFFPDDYLRRAEVPEVLAWLAPANVFSPQIAPPYICPGRILPGTPLVDLLYQVYEIITFYKVSPREDNALTRTACAWTRAHLREFPLDRTPLKRRATATEPAAGKAQPK